MKRFIALISSIVLFFSYSNCIAAVLSDEEDNLIIQMQINNPIITVNGIEKNKSEKGTAPLIINGRTLLPVRSLVESIGGSVEWNDKNREVTLSLGDDEIRLVINSTTAYFNDMVSILDTEPIIINGRTMLPVRFIAEKFGFNVEWNEHKQIITIIRKSVPSKDEFIEVTDSEIQLKSGLSAVRYNGDYMFDKFLLQGGAKSDTELVSFLQNEIVKNAGTLGLVPNTFGCSTISAKNKNDEAVFGRNFDWYNCDALIALSKPQNGYASISTVNTNFIKNAYGNFNSLPEKIRTLISLYAPLDGMNEKGLCVAVLYIEDGAKVEENTDKPDITTTTAIRLLLNQAADIDEALTLLRRYDMHNSLGMMFHFAISDASGKSITVEYVNNEMIVTETPVVTNFYLAEGSKQGIGSTQSHTRFDILIRILENNSAMNASDVKNALESVSKHNFNDGESTEWSIIYNQAQGIAQYYHRENYDKVYRFKIS
jgi:predicted choloylglycine hydrolase